MRFGLFGTGHWAAETQGAALAAHPDVEFVGVWGRSPAKATALADRYGTRAYTDVDALLADVDAVAIALPPDVQGDLALRAARAGRHLLLDKPVALTVEAADQLVAEVDGRALASVVFFTNRFHANVAEFLAHAATRPWASARATLYASIFTPGGPYADSAWRRAHGGLWDLGPHALSLLLPVLGPVDRVEALAGAAGISHVLLRHTGGATSTLSLSLDAPTPVNEVVYYGADGAVPLVEGRPGSSADAFGTAIGELIGQAGLAAPRHACDVRFGRDVVAILADAEAAIRA
ncbi:Gfo/Idh/MocA family oxidoreductase [Longispora sp. NPDC051575]|uniref:Gfo/Idh/MocA family protein n=1 Tax=Longispora sp. NPDC051575 TaxID=3154943 RepID=UPI0034237DC6